MDSTRTGDLETTKPPKWKDVLALIMRGLISTFGFLMLLADISDWVQIGFWRDRTGSEFAETLFSVVVLVGLIVLPSLRFRATPFILVSLGLAANYLMSSWAMGILLVIAVILATPNFRVHFGGLESTKERLTPPFRNWFLGIFGLSLMTYLFVEIPNIRSALTNTRNEANCKSMKSPETCGGVALHIINNARQTAQLEDGLKRLDAICKEGNLSACRYAIGFRSPGYINEYFYDELLRNLNHECSKEVPEACWLLMRYSEEIPPMGYTRVREITEPQCQESGDFYSCDTFGRSRLTEEEMCPTGYDPDVLRRCCSEGLIGQISVQNHFMCSFVPGEDVQARAARFISDAKYQGVPITEKVLPETDEFALACEAGDAIACVAEVLRLEDVRPLGTPTPDGLKEEWERFLAASCEAGSNLACLAYAIRLLDVPLKEKPDLSGAEVVLNTACDRGHHESCWWLVSLFEGYEERTFDEALARCRRGGADEACWVLEDLTLQKLGLHRWKLNRFEENRAYQKQCLAEDLVSCSRYLSTYKRNGHIFPVQIRRLYSAAELACKLGRHNGCEWASNLASMYPARGVKEHHEAYCKRAPARCNQYEPKMR